MLLKTCSAYTSDAEEILMFKICKIFKSKLHVRRILTGIILIVFPGRENWIILQTYNYINLEDYSAEHFSELFYNYCIYINTRPDFIRNVSIRNDSLSE